MPCTVRSEDIYQHGLRMYLDAMQYHNADHLDLFYYWDKVRALRGRKETSFAGV